MRASEKMPGLAIILISDSKILAYSSKERVYFLSNSVDIKFSKLEARGRGCLALYLLQQL